MPKGLITARIKTECQGRESNLLSLISMGIKCFSELNFLKCLFASSYYKKKKKKKRIWFFFKKENQD